MALSTGMTQPTRHNFQVARSARDTAGTIAQNLAIQDLGAMAFHSYMLARAFNAPDSPDALLARSFALALWTVTVCTVLLVRGEILPPGRIRALLYRIGIFAPMVSSYFELRFLLPALQPQLLDDRLHALDIAIFGTTPALWMAQFNRPPVVEWISFFYYSYFYLMGTLLIPTLLFDRGQRMRELLVGALVVCAGGHFVYTLVPGVGPFRTIEFPGPIAGGFWWHQVQVTVANAGAQLDIFPSLHTAYPVYFSLHAFAHRREAPFKHTWFIIAFFAVNMVIATMFLRWHWFVDVLAGMTLAATARAAAVAVERRERQRGCEDDPRQPVWERLFR